MLHVSYEIWAVAVAVLLIGIWTIRRVIRRKRPERECTTHNAIPSSACQDHDIEHRALMFLMAQKTDSVLAALARTIEEERQKLGGVVRKPSMVDALDTFQAETMHIPDNHQSPYDQVLPMARNGIAVPKIARQLKLPEAEIAMVMRLYAA